MNRALALFVLSLTLAATAQAQPAEMHATELLGRPVIGERGERLGHIEDLVLSETGERVRFALLATNGIAGVGDAYLPYPLTAFRQTGSGALRLRVPQRALEDVEGIDAERYRGTLARASEILGRDVVDWQGEEVGEVRDLLVGLDDARVRHVVIDYDAALGPGGAPLALAPSRVVLPGGEGPLAIRYRPEYTERPASGIVPSDERTRIQPPRASDVFDR